MNIKILAVDDEKAALDRLERTIRKVNDTFEIQCFQDPDEALLHIKEDAFPQL